MQGIKIINKLGYIILVISGMYSFIIHATELDNDNQPLDIEYSSMLETEWAYGMVQNSSQKLELIFEPEVTVEFQDDTKFTTIVRLHADAQDKLESGDPDQDATSKVSKRLFIGSHAELEVREFYFEKEWRQIYFKIGKQQIVWGTADGLKVLDVVNPQNFREFILDDFDDSRIPLWTVNTEIPINNSVIQLLWVPDQSYHILPEPGSLYAFTSPLLVPVVPEGVSVDLRPVERPDRIISDADYGMRFSSFVNGWDMTLNYLYHYYDTPVLFRNLNLELQPTVTVTPRYERTHLLGGTFSNAFGEFVLRGEIGYLTDRYFLSTNSNDSDGVIKSDELAYVLGLDWSGLTDLFLSMQLFQSYILDEQSGLVRDKTDNTLTFLAQRNFMNDTLVTEILWLYNINNDDGLLRPKIKYEWQDDITIWFGADVFYGDSKGLFGQFDDNDRVVFGMAWGM